MPSRVLKWFTPRRSFLDRNPRAPLVLVNGLAEQSESWFANKRTLARRFDVELPEMLVYDGDHLHHWIDAGRDVTVDYLVGRLADHLAASKLQPPYHLTASSLGCQVALTYAIADPAKVDRLVLLCPSGFHGDENLPMLEGVRRSRYDSLVASAFHEPRFADDRLVGAFEQKFQDRRWKKGVLKTLRGTVGHSVEHLLPQVQQPTLMIWGAEDRVLSDVPGSIRAAERIPNVRQIVLPRCGHAPQIEKSRLVNRLIERFLEDRLGPIPRAFDHRAFLNTEAQRKPSSAPLVPSH